jgi:23S rRNA (uracil1939-C5)-methyltransferase
MVSPPALRSRAMSTKSSKGPNPPPGLRAPGATECRYYDRRQCGGCTQLHVPYDLQTKAKHQSLEALLRPMGVVAVKPIVPSPDRKGWRTSVKLCLHEERDGNKTVGLYQDDGFRVVSQNGCLVQHPIIGRFANEFFQATRRGMIRFTNHRDRVFQKRRLKYLIIRAGGPLPKDSGNQAGRTSLGVIICHTGVSKDDLLKLARSIPLVESGAVSVYESRLTPASEKALTGKYIDYLCGPETFPFQLHSETYPLTPGAFFQANQKMAERLVSEVQESLKEGGDWLLDLYGGFGAYSIPLAGKFRHFSVVDGNFHAILAAQRSMVARGVTSGEAHAMRCEDFLNERISDKEATSVTHVILNPPRNGLSQPVVAGLSPQRFLNLKKIIYVSCNPNALARDLVRMRETWPKVAFEISSVRGFDMFPHTSHVELVAVLDMKRKA